MRLSISVFLLVAVATSSRAQRGEFTLICPPARDSLRVSIDTNLPMSISGEVTNRDTGRPLAGAYVTLDSTGRHASTDSVGAFRIDHIPDGHYTVRVRATGFAVDTQSLVMSGGVGGARVRIPLTPQYFDRCWIGHQNGHGNGVFVVAAT